MADKNYVKALRRAKSKKLFYTNLLIFIPLGFVLLISNVTFIAPNVPWSLIPIGLMSMALVIHRLLLFKRLQKTVFSRDYSLISQRKK